LSGKTEKDEITKGKKSRKGPAEKSKKNALQKLNKVASA